MEIVRSDWNEVPRDLSIQTLSDFYQRILEKINDDRFYYKINENEIANAAKATRLILERLNLISTSIAATQDYNNSFVKDLHLDLKAKTEGLTIFYTDFVKFQQNLANYLNNMESHNLSKMDSIINELRLDMAQVEEKYEEIIRGIKTVYNKHSKEK